MKIGGDNIQNTEDQSLRDRKDKMLSFINPQKV